MRTVIVCKKKINFTRSCKLDIELNELCYFWKGTVGQSWSWVGVRGVRGGGGDLVAAHIVWETSGLALLSLFLYSDTQNFNCPDIKVCNTIFPFWEQYSKQSDQFNLPKEFYGLCLFCLASRNPRPSISSIVSLSALFVPYLLCLSLSLPCTLVHGAHLSRSPPTLVFFQPAKHIPVSGWGKAPSVRSGF